MSYRRRRGSALLVLLVVAAALLTLLLRHPSGKPAPRSESGSGQSTVAVKRAAAKHGRHRTVDLGEVEGRLPQTETVPASKGARFEGQMDALWNAVLRDQPKLGRAAFFPRSAYEQLKAIPDAGSDWENRLFSDYSLDIAAAHELIAGDPSTARLAGVHAVDSYAHWVPPGVCANAIGYYEMPGARVVYDYRGAEHSFAIASMISWRGVWYVVHLGAVLREAPVGIVDEAAAGPGTPAYSGTC